MRTVHLSSPLTGNLREIILRVPGSAICTRIGELVDEEGRIPTSEIPRFASRLSGISEAKISRLPSTDRTAIGQAIEGLFMRERRRQIARNAAAKPGEHSPSLPRKDVK